MLKKETHSPAHKVRSILILAGKRFDPSLDQLDLVRASQDLRPKPPETEFYFGSEMALISYTVHPEYHASQYVKCQSMKYIVDQALAVRPCPHYHLYIEV